MYFVSFVLTAQFVLINVVVAVLMKHLDDSNKEAQEEAEMDAEIELELAQGTLCCMGAPSCGGGGVEKGLVAAGPGPGGPAGGRERVDSRGEAGRRMRQAAATAHQGLYNSRSSSRTLYSPAQVSMCICVCVDVMLVKERPVLCDWCLCVCVLLKFCRDWKYFPK